MPVRRVEFDMRKEVIADWGLRFHGPATLTIDYQLLVIDC